MSRVPTHGPWCNTTSWPTSCPQCGQSVFFRWTCGSAVFFDQLGQPWPIHQDGDDSDNGNRNAVTPSWVRDVTRRIDSEGRFIAEVSELGFSVIRSGENSIRDPFRSRQRRGTRNVQPEPIVAVGAGDGETLDITGILRELDRKVDPMKPFGYNDDGPMTIAMGKAMLGARWVGEFGRVTIHTPRSHTRQMESYTAWLPHSFVANRKIIRGITVSASLVSLDASETVRIWFCDDFMVNR